VREFVEGLAQQQTGNGDGQQAANGDQGAGGEGDGP
jgi:hypothetical protein